MRAIPSSLIIIEGAYSMDGGSIYLEMEEPDEVKHTLHLPQHSIPANFRPEVPPGALVFDDEVLSVRGPEEASLIQALREATYPTVGATDDEGERLAPPDQRLVVGDDLKRFMTAIDEGPTAALRQLVRQIIAFVESPAFVEVARRHGRLSVRAG